MTYNARNRLLLRTLATVGIVAGVLSLLGVRPMNSRTIEVVLGTASLVAGLALFALTLRAKPAPQTSIA
jgi:uncharacterized membrane protein HdeD (DUF308 family)